MAYPKTSAAHYALIHPQPIADLDESERTGLEDKLGPNSRACYEML